MTLRQQVTEIVLQNGGNSDTINVMFPVMVEFVASKFFVDETPESSETRAVRKALKLLRSHGWIPEEEPGVE